MKNCYSCSFACSEIEKSYSFFCERISKYFGDIVEKSDAKELFQKPYHPYTNLLLKSVPKTNQKIEIDQSYNR